MEPNYNYQSNDSAGGLAALIDKRGKFLLAALGLGAVLIVGIVLFQASRFHIVKTSPSLKKVGSGSANITIYFNKQLAAKSLDMSLDFNTKTSYKVSDKVIVITLSEPLTVNRTYTITIKSITAASGDKLTNKVLKFTARNIAFQDLPKEQQKTLIQEQNSTPKPYRERLDFEGTEELIRQGISSAQVDGFKEAIFNYSDSVKKEFSQVAVDTNSLTTGPDENNPGNFYATFKLTIDQQTFNARLDYYGLSQVRLYLNSPGNNSPVFDSNTITTP